MNARTSISAIQLMDNRDIAQMFRLAADLLQQQGDGPFRINAYRAAADVAEHYPEPLSDVQARGGLEDLEKIPSIGLGLAHAIDEMLKTGRWSTLERLLGSYDPVSVLQEVPSLGRHLAEQINGTLGIETLEDLELAAYDGRLEAVSGLGPRRIAGIKAYLAGILSRRQLAEPKTAEPSVGDVLEIDREYRERAEKDSLPKVAPLRFNPQEESWLPILHRQIGPWSFTALFSNSARAHRLGRTKDWVIVFFSGKDHLQSQRTVVTETHGPLAGKRVVRGRESECFEFYGIPLSKLSQASMR